MTKLRLAEILGKKIFEKSQFLEKVIWSLRGKMTINQGWKLCSFLRESAEVSLTNEMVSCAKTRTQAEIVLRPADGQTVSVFLLQGVHWR